MEPKPTEIEVGKQNQESVINPKDPNITSIVSRIRWGFESSISDPIPSPKKWPTAEEFRESFRSGPSSEQIREELEANTQVKLPDSVINTSIILGGSTFTEYPNGVVISTPDYLTAKRLPTADEVHAAVERAIAARYAKAQTDRHKYLRFDDNMQNVRFTK